MPVVNTLLDNIEASSEYKKYKVLTQEVLLEQWNDLIMSGLVVKMYNNFFKAIQKSKEKTTTKKVKKAIQHASRTEVNKLLLQGRIGSIKKLERYVQDKSTKELRRVGGYSGYGMSTKTYLYSVMNKGGQSELNKYLGVDKIKFNLTSDHYKQVITNRVNTLVKGLDDHTKNAFSKQLIKGMEAGETKKQLVARLQSVGEKLSKTRADRIVGNETSAAVEYMRHETAKLNGVSTKTWSTLDDERVCSVCGPAHDTTVKIENNFPEVGLDIPPAHTNCRCYVDYEYDNLCSDYVTDKVSKAKYEFYEEGQESASCCNPNAVWAGGNGLVGKDAIVGAYYLILKDRGKEEFKTAWKETSWAELDDMGNSIEQLVEETGNGKLFEDIQELKTNMNRNELGLEAEQFMQFTSASTSKLVIAQARSKLTDGGFVQLAHKMGIRAKVPTYNAL